MFKVLITFILQLLVQEAIATGDIHCGQVPVVKFGSFSHGASNVGSRRSIICRAFTNLQGNSAIECQSSGKWSQPGQCKIITCEAPVIANAIVSSGTNEFGHRALFLCHHGFKLVGSNQIECKRDSTWDIQGSCVSFCGNPPDVANGKYKIQGLSAALSCKEGFQVEGNTTVTCNVELKQWTAVGKCAKTKSGPANYTQSFVDTCGPVPVIKNGSVSVSEGEGFLVGMIRCQPDFEVVGDRLFFCMPTGTMTQPGSCQIPAIEKCGIVPEIENGLVLPGDNKIGRRRTISCNSRLHLSGTKIIECQKDGHWSEPGKCIEKTCPKPEIENGEVENETREIGKLVYFSCHKGYKLHGVGEMICSDSNWHIYGSCKHACGEIPQVPNGSLKLSNSITADIVCDSGFKIRGMPSISCDENLAVWTNPGQCIKATKADHKSMISFFPRLDDLDLLFPLNEISKGSSLVNSERIFISFNHLKTVC